MEEELHKIIQHKSLLKAELHETESNIKIDKVAVLGDGVLTLASLYCVYLGLYGLNLYDTYVHGVMGITFAAIAAFFVDHNVDAFRKDLSSLSEDYDIALDIIDELEALDPEDDDVQRINKRLHIKC